MRPWMAIGEGIDRLALDLGLGTLGDFMISS
jgi:hypothetical protein